MIWSEKSLDISTMKRIIMSRDFKLLRISSDKASNLPKRDLRFISLK